MAWLALHPPWAWRAILIPTVEGTLKFLIGVHKMKSIVSCFYTDFVTHSKVPVIARNSMPVGEMGIKNKRKGHPGNLYI